MEIDEGHLPAVLEIYRHYVLNTSSTFHTVVPTADEMRTMVYFDHPVYRTFVMLSDDEICGYVILDQHKKREAYDGTAEVSVYLRPDHVGQGIGTAAIQYIEEYAIDQGLHALVATISGENGRSIKAFERNGYVKCAHYREVGKKFERYIDVVAYEKLLG
ncbi:MAG: N-acetyltransferase family protein [Deltaproteobacteria bacterium]